MYTKYYGFNEKPFTLTPNPRFIYLSKNHKEAFAHLLYGINNHYGFIVLAGEVGTGKTTVLRTLLNQLGEDNYRSALIFNPCPTAVELLRSINHEFGLNSTSEFTTELLEDLNSFLLKENSRGITVVLVIDEAQNLSPEILEQLRLISNLETENDKLIQIVLAGQPELSTLLNLPELRQLNQRITVRYRLQSMSIDETRTYIRHRMMVAGETGGVSFSRPALKLIHLYTRGLPRLINNLCDRALLIGYGDERRRITAGIVARAIKELLIKQQGKRLALAIACIAIACVALSLVISGWLPGKPATGIQSKVHSTAAADNSPASTPATAQALIKPEPAVAAPTMENQNLLRLQQEVLSYDQNEVHRLAFNAIAGKWGARPITMFSGRLTVPKQFSRLAAKRNLKITAFKGTLDEAIRFDLPFLVLTKVAGSLDDGYCLAVTSAGNNSVSIAPALFGSGTLSKNDLNSIAGGTFYLIWQNSGRIPDKIDQGNRNYEIRTLQRLLRKAGTYNGAIDGNYNTITARAVGDFQRSAGIPPDETVGELTLAALTKYYPNQKMPSITATGSSQ
ncbi:MAG TPA: AAA family ATPase [Dongiaceae bacterium]|nr:AAA family ATPase [Dongiaceae bacterium]